jgi:hypothetical protein
LTRSVDAGEIVLGGGMISTRYAMCGFEPGEELFRVSSLSCLRLLQPLPDPFAGISAGGDIEQALTGFGVLHDCGGLPLYAKHDRAFALLELFHEILNLRGTCQRLNVPGDFQPWFLSLFVGAPFQAPKVREENGRHRPRPRTLPDPAAP